MAAALLARPHTSWVPRTLTGQGVVAKEVVASSPYALQRHLGDLHAAMVCVCVCVYVCMLCVPVNALLSARKEKSGADLHVYM